MIAVCLQNNNNLDACCEHLSQLSHGYLYGSGCEENHSSPDGHAHLRLLNHHMTQLNLGRQSQHVHVAPGRDGLRHSLSEGPLPTSATPPPVAGGEFYQQEPQSAPPLQGPSAALSIFAAMEPARKPQPPQQLGLYPLGGKGPPGVGGNHHHQHHQQPRFNPITVTLAPNIQPGRKTPTSLHIHGKVAQSGLGSPQGNSIYIRPFSGRAGPAVGGTGGGRAAQYSPTSQPQQQIYQICHTGAPQQHQQHQTSHVYMPISSPTNTQPPSFLPSSTSCSNTSSTSSSSSSVMPTSLSTISQYNISTAPCKKQIEIKLESPQRSNSTTVLRTGPASRSSSSSSCPSSSSSGSSGSTAMMPTTPLSIGGGSLSRSQPTVYISASPPAAASTPCGGSEDPGAGPHRSQPTFYISAGEDGGGGGGGGGGGRNPHTVYISANTPLQGPTGGRALGGQVSMGPAYIHHHPPKPRAGSVGGSGVGGSVGTVVAAGPSPRVVVTQPNTKYTFKITVSPNKPPAVSPGVVSPTFEPTKLLGLPSDLYAETPDPLHLSDPLAAHRERPSEPRRLSVGSDDVEYTQGEYSYYWATRPHKHTH